MKISIPKYTLGEEIVNAISHGIGALLAIAGLVLLLVKANTPLEYVTCSIFGTSMILLYIISTIYHSLSPKLTGKKVLRVLDHVNVYLLVFGTYFPACLLGIGGIKSIILVCIVGLISIIGIILTCVNVDKYQYISIICHLASGWSAVFGFKDLYYNTGIYGFLFLLIGGILYSIGAILYKIGSKKKYIHSVFHFFCMSATLMQFFSIYFYML